MKINFTIAFLIFNLIVLSNVIGQNYIFETLVPDSTITKLKIKKITENGYGNTFDPTPWWRIVESFDSSGRIVQLISINYSHHKFIKDFVYLENKNQIKVLEKYYDWNHPNSERKDTILKTSASRYDLETKTEIKGIFKKKKKKKRKRKKAKSKYGSLSDFIPKITYDSLGRITKEIDSIKFGYYITYFEYDDIKNSVQKKCYISRNSEKPKLEVKSIFNYDDEGNLIELIDYFRISYKDGIMKFHRETKKNYSYNSKGLVSEILITEFYSSSKDSRTSKIYKYNYEFY